MTDYCPVHHPVGNDEPMNSDTRCYCKPIYPTLAEVLAAHQSYYVHGDDVDRCTGCRWTGSAGGEHFAHQSEVFAASRRIDTVEQLQACPRRTIVLAADDKPFVRGPAEDGQDYWTSGEIQLPARLIFHPEVDQ